jgi:hypothetical protein
VLVGVFPKVGLAELKSMETGCTWGQEGPFTPRRNGEVPGRELPSRVRVQNMGAAGATAVPIVQFFDCHSHSFEDCQNAVVKVVGRSMEGTARKIVHSHV